MREIPVGLLEVELEAHGHASHASHLQVDDHEVGLVFIDRRSDVVAGVDLDDLGARTTHDGDDVGPN